MQPAAVVLTAEGAVGLKEAFVQIQAEVNEALAVIPEDAQLQLRDEIPLILRKQHLRCSVFTGSPVKQ